MKIIIVAIAAFLLTGCPSLGGYQSMTPEQITAAAKDNKAVIQCADVPVSAYLGGGVAKARSVIIDSGTVRFGQVVMDTCDKITFTNENKAPVTLVPVPRTAP